MIAGTQRTLLHRHDFNMEDAPSGACILYAVSCGLSDKELGDQFDILVKTGGPAEETENEEGTTTMGNWLYQKIL